jgi:hypothetical protein
MEEMASAMDVIDYQAIRSSLTRLRKGRVRNPASPGDYFRPLPVRWNLRDRKYYDLSRVDGEAVLARVPGDILSSAFKDVLTRVATVESSMGQDGLADAAAKGLLNDEETRELLLQIPFNEIWRVQDYLQGIARARQLLELQPGTTSRTLPAGQA